jgi:hypothetical protein
MNKEAGTSNLTEPTEIILVQRRKQRLKIMMPALPGEWLTSGRFAPQYYNSDATGISDWCGLRENESTKSALCKLYVLTVNETDC